MSSLLGKGHSSTKGVSSNSAPEQNSVCVQITESTVITFPDKNLEKTIRDEIQCPTGDILKDDVDKITNLKNAEDKHITNLSGIENLTNLALLNLSNNQIKNIEPLKGLTNLTNLNLSENQMNNIEPLKGLINLTHLNLAANQMSNIEPLKGLTKLTDLNLNTNQMSNIEPLKGLTNLTNLDLATNQLIDIEPLKGLTNLTNLDLATNQMSDINPLKGLTNLTKLDLSTIQINNIEPLKELTNLTELNLDTNQIEDYSPVNVCFKNVLTASVPNTTTPPKQKPISTSTQVTDSTANTFPDGNLEKLIRDTLQHPTGEILKGDVDKIITVQDNHITNLTAIENSSDLNLDTNQISNIEPLK